MVLDFEYGINTGNRFLNFVDHDEDPEDFIAAQTKPEEVPKKSTKDAKKVATTVTKKAATTAAAAASSAGSATAGSGATRTNKENFTGKPTNTDQRRQQSNVLGDNNNQQGRFEGGRGAGRGFSRRGGSAGQDRPPYEGGGRGGGQQRTQRFNKFEGGQQQQQQPGNEPSGFEQSGDAWGNDQGNDNQPFSGYRGRGRGRGGPRRGFYEGDRGGGRGRGRGGRGNLNNRNFEEGSHQQQETQESSQWQQNTESNFDNTRSQSARTGGQEGDVDVSQQERPFESDNVRRGGRGQFRSRTFRSNRNYGGDRPNYYEREGGDGNNEEYRYNRRLHDRQPRSNVSGVKPIEKKDGEGAHNWGSPTENLEENIPAEEVAEGTEGAPAAAPSKDWAQQVDEAEKQMTLDEYKKQKVAQRQAQQEKVPQFNRRTAGEGEDLSQWNPYSRKYRKKNDDEESNGDEAEEGSDAEEHESEEEAEEEQTTGKKKIITIPLQFKPIEIPRGPAGSRGGPRRGAAGRYRDRPNRDDEENRPKSPSQQQASFFSQRTGDYPNEEQQSRPYRGGARQGSGRGEYRRSYGNSARGSRGGGYNRSNAGPNTLDLGNNLDFPTLPKQE